MKKIIFLLLLGTVVFSACAVTKVNTVKSSSEESSQQSTYSSEELNSTSESIVQTTMTLSSESTESFSTETSRESTTISSISESEEITESSIEIITEERNQEEEKNFPVILVKGNTLFTFDVQNESINEFKKIDFDFYPNSINSVVPILVGQDEDSIYLYNIINDEKNPFFVCKNVELRSPLWSKDGNNLVFNVYFKDHDKNVVYIYNRIDESIVAVDMADNSNYCWSDDGNSLLISQKSYKKSIDKYEFRLNKCELGKSIKTIYKVDAANGNIYPLINYANEADDKAYTLLKIYDENDLSSTYVYDFKKDELESYMVFSEAYDTFMNRYTLDNDILKLYSQLGKWLFPNVIEDENGEEVYISDGITFFYYPDKTSRGEVEVGNFKHIVYTSWEVK